MGYEHLRRETVEHFQRLDVGVPADVVDVDQYLGGIADAGNRAVPVLPAPEGEIGQGADLKKVRAGHLEESSQQLIGGPLVDEVGKVIEDIADLAAAFLDHPVHLGGEIVESGGGVDFYNGQTVSRLGDGGMGGQA